MLFQILQTTFMLRRAKRIDVRLNVNTATRRAIDTKIINNCA